MPKLPCWILITLIKYSEQVPRIFLNNIRITEEGTKHFQQLKGMFVAYRGFQTAIPNVYLSKSQIRVGNYDDLYCKNPYPTGTAEDLLRGLERQFLEIVYLLYGGAYRSIHAILRYMLETTQMAALSIIDKKKLTGESRDESKSMSYVEFCKHLHDNTIARPDHRRNKKKYDCRKENKHIPDLYIKHIKIGDKCGVDVLKLTFNDLSRHIHGSVWKSLRTDGDYDETGVEETGMFTPTLNLDEYHIILKKILWVHEIIFYLVFIAIYENLIYFNRDDAKTFAKKARAIEENLKNYKLQFPSLEKIISSPIDKQIDDLGDIESCDTKFDPEYDDLIDERQGKVCKKCDTVIYFDYELCPSCHYDNIQLPNSQGPFI